MGYVLFIILTDISVLFLQLYSILSLIHYLLFSIFMHCQCFLGFMSQYWVKKIF